MRRTRDTRLIEKRNAKIAARYYYWTEIQRYRSDDAIRQLSEEEFFLSEATILRILGKSTIGTAALRRNMRLGVHKSKRTKLTPEELLRLITFMPDTIEEQKDTH